DRARWLHGGRRQVRGYRGDRRERSVVAGRSRRDGPVRRSPDRPRGTECIRLGAESSFGGHNCRRGSGSVDLTGGQVAGDQAFRSAQIGHGGPHDALGDYSGDISVSGADINLDAGGTATNYARIGHGGWTSGENTGTRTGDISVSTPGEISIDSAGGIAAIGHHNEDAAGTIF